MLETGRSASVENSNIHLYTVFTDYPGDMKDVVDIV